jgi:transposase InsO family protein
MRPMPWVDTNVMKERLRFVRDYESGQWEMAELCEHYGISRRVGYKWLKRFEEYGVEGLKDRSRRPQNCPHATSSEVVERLVALKVKYGWGARKLRRMLEQRHPRLELPARSTVFDILERRGLTKKRRRKKKWKHPGAVPLLTMAPNQVWTVDFKGQFRTRNGVYCYPLTIVDHYSRYLLRCHALLSVRTRGAKPVFERLFREVGLPSAIRSDNGAPFASTGIFGLCALNVWWLKLGINLDRIEPSSPQQNGAHERMHRTLKQETTLPAAANRRQQQVKFDRFQELYNEERPHEALDDETPASLWQPSTREYPERISAPEYPGHFEVRRVSNAGTFRLNSKQLFLSNALKDEYIGLEPIDDGLWNIIFYETLLGRFDERTRQMTGAERRR